VVYDHALHEEEERKVMERMKRNFTGPAQTGAMG
jgi:hypothetical protein